MTGAAAPAKPSAAPLPAETVPPGSEGLFFLPYLTGERSPHPDPNARGAFIGIIASCGECRM